MSFKRGSTVLYSTVVCIVEKCYVLLCIIVKLHLKNKSVSLVYELLSRYHGDTIESGAVYSTVVCIMEKYYVPLSIIIQLHLENQRECQSCV